MQYKILLIDESEQDRNLLQDAFAKNDLGFEISLRGGDGLEMVRDFRPDLIILSSSLPDIAGIEVCHILKQDSRTLFIPIIMLTENNVSDRIQCLEAGCDDVLSRPFSPEELLVRVQAVLRRLIYKGEPEQILEKGALRINLSRHLVEIRNRPVELTSKEFDLLLLLVRKSPRALSREVLLDTVWGYSADIITKTLDIYIYRLRKKLGPVGKQIVTVSGVGYKFQ